MMRKDKMLNSVHKQKESNSLSNIKIGAIVGFLLTIIFMYILLLGQNNTFLSLNILLSWTERLHSSEKLIIMSLIPVYLAILIFGGGAIGGFFGGICQNFFERRIFCKKRQKEME